MATRSAVIEEARGWVGTPYRHQAMLKGVGSDCVGLIRGAGVAVGAMPALDEEWAVFGGYSRTPNPRRMEEGMNKFLVPLGHTPPAPGDIVWLQWRADLPMHLAIIAEDKSGRHTIIHSYSHVGRVVEHGFTQEWIDRVHSYWRYPNIED